MYPTFKSTYDKQIIWKTKEVVINEIYSKYINEINSLKVYTIDSIKSIFNKYFKVIDLYIGDYYIDNFDEMTEDEFIIIYYRNKKEIIKRCNIKSLYKHEQKKL